MGIQSKKDVSTPTFKAQLAGVCYWYLPLCEAAPQSSRSSICFTCTAKPSSTITEHLPDGKLESLCLLLKCPSLFSSRQQLLGLFGTAMHEKHADLITHGRMRVSCDNVDAAPTKREPASMLMEKQKIPPSSGPAAAFFLYSLASGGPGHFPSSPQASQKP